MMHHLFRHCIHMYWKLVLFYISFFSLTLKRMLHTPTSMPSTGYQTIREQRKHTNRWKHLHRRLHRSVNEMRKYVWTRPNVSVIVLNYKKI